MRTDGMEPRTRRHRLAARVAGYGALLYAIASTSTATPAAGERPNRHDRPPPNPPAHQPTPRVAN